jgi:hypothetical protein
LHAGLRNNTEFLCASVLPDIERNFCGGKGRKTLRGIYPHLDNAPAHNVKRSRQEIARTRANRVTHSAYSQDDAPSDFVLFGRLKHEVVEFPASSAEDILSEIPNDILTTVYNK